MSSHVYDLSLPLSSLLRIATAEPHKHVENTQGASWLARGELDKEEYVRFLMMLWHIYDTLERALEQHSMDPSLAPTYNPALLARAQSLSADISHLLQVSESTWQSHPQHLSLEENPPLAMKVYVNRIKSMSDSSDPSPLLAHSYVRYLGDLSGGQHIRRAISKAYELGSSDHEEQLGAQFYSFKQLGGTKPCTIGDLKKIKEWFRVGMDQGVGDNEAKKLAIIEEACMAFDLNAALFASLRSPSHLLNLHMDSSPDIISPALPTSVSLTKQHLNIFKEVFPSALTIPWVVLTVILTAISTRLLFAVQPIDSAVGLA